MERDEFLRGMEEAAERLRERVATVHERVACPNCGAPRGVKCWRAGSRRPDVELKHPHAERLRADGIPDR